MDDIPQLDVPDIAMRMKKAQSDRIQFSSPLLDRTVGSLAALDVDSQIDWNAYRALVAAVAHVPHKEWESTKASAAALASIVGGPSDTAFQSIFRRILGDGGWVPAEAAAARRRSDDKPWAVLITGVNGIRKTSSVYQPWFGAVLREALGDQIRESSDLPIGGNSFFRQLDFIVSTVAREELKDLYQIDDIANYAAFKDAIYVRYRTLAEMLGVLLVNQAAKSMMNVMVETSGRDIAMYNYVDENFPDDTYRKLVVHFEINDIQYAERSVDARMLGEQLAGKAALLKDDPQALIDANAGGPYGSGVLADIRTASDAVFESVQQDPRFTHWHKAKILITGRDDAAWTCRAQVEGSQAHEFESRVSRT